MRTFIDPDLCIACGLCIDTCPDLYEWSEEVAKVKLEKVPENMQDCAQEAEEGCPTDAISHKD